MEILWDITFYPWTKPNPDICHVQTFYKPWAEIPTYHKPWPRVRMSILALGRKHKEKENSQSKKGRRHKEKKKEKFPIKEWEKAKKERKFPIKDQKKTKETSRKVSGPDNIWTIQNCHQVNEKKKGNHDLKWPSPFDSHSKSCASVTCSPHTKQKQKKERAKKTQSQISHQKTHS